MKGKGLMWRLLRKNISAGQMIGFALANLVGLAIVVIAIQFYTDVKPVFSGEDSFLRKDFMIITKHVEGIGSLLGDRAEFSDEAIAELEAQPWVRRVGRFATSDFGIDAYFGAGGSHTLRTQFFFESIPDEFIDVKATGWGFDPAQQVVPIIMSKDYLSLYNFGFAQTQGMPQVSEATIGSVPITFRFSGNGHDEIMRGRIVGFSNRLNTIIVPYDFMRWANERYSTGQFKSPARLIVEVSNPGDPAVDSFMKSHSYEIAGDKADSNRAAYFLTVVTTIVIAVGVIISALAFFVLLLSIHLLLQKNSEKLQNLLLLGYSPSEVARPYVKMVLIINATILVAAVALMLIARWRYIGTLQAIGIEGGTLAWSLTAAAVIIGAITAGNVVAIRRRVSALWHG